MKKGFGIDLGCCINSTQRLLLKELPKSMVIVGGGVIDIEMATEYGTFEQMCIQAKVRPCMRLRLMCME